MNTKGMSPMERIEHSNLSPEEKEAKRAVLRAKWRAKHQAKRDAPKSERADYYREKTQASAKRYNAIIDGLPPISDAKIERGLAELRALNQTLARLREKAVHATSAREIQRINQACVPLEREIRGVKVTLGIIVPEVSK